MIKYCIAAVIIAASGVLLPSCRNSAKPDDKLVILHVNDTHSQILPGNDGLGGVMRRKAVIDSVRGAEKNVMLVDAGDVVQGTLYFYLYGGVVEQEVMNMLGVDLRILGNHEFDNGIDSLGAVLKYSDATKIATNYKLDNTSLDGLFVPYYIKNVGYRKVGFIGINLNPEGMIADGNYDGLEFLPIIETAEQAAEHLKKQEGVDAVVALTHIGYNPAGLVGDSLLAVSTKNIDVIIGGHSHDTIDPKTETGFHRSHMKNSDGKPVLVVQTGKAGRNIGKIEIDLSKNNKDYPTYELIRIDSRYDNYVDSALAKTIETYSLGVDSLMTDWIGTTKAAMPNDGPELLNFFADYVYEQGRGLVGNVDLAVVNKGGLRSSLPEGKFSKGQIINMVPFRNYITVVELSGKDLADVFDVMAMTDGNGVSENVAVEYEKNAGGASATKIMISGLELDENKIYRVATIDYLAKGGDYMKGFTRGKVIAQSRLAVFDDLIEYFTEGEGNGRILTAPSENRWKLVGNK